MMKSWKTTLGGACASLGTLLSGAAHAGSAPAWVGAVGTLLATGGMLLLGAAARDNGVTSEQGGAK